MKHESPSSRKFDKVSLYCVHLDQCDPTKCTARTLERANLLQVVSPRNIPRHAILLDPFSDTTLSIGDGARALHWGLVVLDCSWKLVLTNDSRTTLPNPTRKLPPFIACNPVNYGKPGKLSSVEALATALLVLERDDQARAILSPFSWGKSFILINKEKIKKI